MVFPFLSLRRVTFVPHSSSPPITTLPYTPHTTLPSRLFETFDEGTDFYIVTELVEGGELFDRIVSKAHYTEKEARDLIKSLLETLNYMHTVGGR